MPYYILAGSCSPARTPKFGIHKRDYILACMHSQLARLGFATRWISLDWAGLHPGLHWIKCDPIWLLFRFNFSLTKIAVSPASFIRLS